MVEFSCHLSICHKVYPEKRPSTTLTFLVIVLRHMEGIENVVIVVEKDVSRAGTVLQDGDHFPL